MNESRQMVKVGLFVFIGMVLIGALLVRFSKGGSLLTPTYEIKLETRNVGGIKEGAAVLIAGVPVGNVKSVELGADGRSVILRLKIQERYQAGIRHDARFIIEQAGFLGDQFVAIVPGKNEAPVVQDGETVKGEDPFNFQEIARSASGLIQKVDQAVGKLNETVERIDTVLLSEETLTNITVAVGNFRGLSDRALVAIDTVDRLLKTNSPAVSASVSNLVGFSHELRQVSAELNLLIETNRTPLLSSMSNIQTATAQVNGILADVQAGKGLAGVLLNDPQLKLNVSLLASNLTVSSSNLNKLGLWRFLWKPKSE